MTTTAEKIKREFELLTARNAALHRDIESLRGKVIDLQQQESPDPEPLECWLPESVFRSAPKTVKEARRLAGTSQVFQMREVTLQDKKDREDARRYRQAKLIVKAGSIKTKTGAYLLGSCTKDWDETIDKAMESE